MSAIGAFVKLTFLATGTLLALIITLIYLPLIEVQMNSYRYVLHTARNRIRKHGN